MHRLSAPIGVSLCVAIVGSGIGFSVGCDRRKSPAPNDVGGASGGGVTIVQSAKNGSFISVNDVTIEVRDGRLLIGGKDHGPVSESDALTVKDGVVKINGEPRQPTE